MTTILEPAGGSTGPLAQIVGGLGRSAVSEYHLSVQGLNVGPSSTSGPNGGPGFDWQGAPSQATGVEITDLDSLAITDIAVSRCLVGVNVRGNTEKQGFLSIRSTLNSLALKETVTSSGSPDTNRYRMMSISDKRLFASGEDTSCHLDFNAEGRIDDGSSFPAAYNPAVMIPTPAILVSTGKQQKFSGEDRTENGRLFMYVDRLTSTKLSGQGSDTVIIDFSTNHTFGTILRVDRCANLTGAGLIIKDNGPGRLNFADAIGGLDCAAVQLNRIDKACSLPLKLVDIYSARGVQLGDAALGLFSTDIDFAPMNIQMRNNAGLALVIDKAVRCRVPLTANADIALHAGCSDCEIETSVAFIKRGHKIIKDPAATCAVHFTGQIASTKLTGLPWLFDGISVEALSDYGGRPAVFHGGSWSVGTFGPL